MGDACRRHAGARAAAVALSVLMGPGLRADEPPVAAESVVARFGAEATCIPAGTTRMVAFALGAPAESDRTLPASTSDEGTLRIVGEARVTAGSGVGFVRIRGVRPGTATLTVEGASMAVRVIEGRVTAPTVTIVSPATGAAVWGTFAVGAEVDRSEGEGGASDTGGLALRLSTGAVIEPDARLSPGRMRGDPTERLTWIVDADSLPAGAVSLTVVAGAAPAEALGEAVVVRVIRPGAADVTGGEAEAAYEVERPERFRRGGALRVATDAEASGGRFVNNASPDPAVCFPLTVREAGLYQVFIVAGGTLAGGALPTVGLIVDGAAQPATNGRLVSERWHRVTLGVPVRLEPGERVLTPYFLNDFYARLAGGRSVDRNLRLDRIEVARVAGPARRDDEGGAPAEMMAMRGAAPGRSPAEGDGAGAMAPMMGAAPGGEGPAMDAAAGPDAVVAAMPRDEMGLGGAPLRVAWARPLHGQSLTGSLTLEGQVWVAGQERGQAAALRAPRVTLLVNGAAVASQHTLSPRFWLDASWLRPGANTVELAAAMEDGFEARAPAQRVEWMPPAGTPAGPGRAWHRFTVHDPAWEPSIRARLTREQQPRERLCAAFPSNGSEALNLPADLSGEFEVSVEARGQDYRGPAVVTVRLRTPGSPLEPALLGEAAVPARWETRRVGAGPVMLPPGPKQLLVGFENDAYDPPQDGRGGGDRNLWVQAVVLAAPSPADSAPPRVEVLYPPEGQEVTGADAVVVSLADDRECAAAELVVDGEATGVRVESPRMGPVVLPLVARGLSEGTHALSVRVRDGAGRETESAARGFTVRAGPAAGPGPYERALHVLDRFAFGPDERELAAVLTMGPEAWLRDRLSRPLEDAGDAAALGAAVAAFPGRGVGEVQRRAVMHALLTPNPARARFVWWAENHFSTWVRKTEGPRKWAEHVAFSRLGAAPFFDLLLASARSPAMLRYLDQENSYATRLNENYAREVMELHTLGVHGGYTQQDVTNLARLLTGWTATREGDGRSAGETAVYTFRFDPALHDRRAVRVIGIDFPPVEASPGPGGVAEGYDRVRSALEALAAHPSAARFISRKMAEHYVGCPAPEGLVEDLASVYQRTGGDTAEMLLAIAAHPAFRGAGEGAGRPPARLAHPFDYAVRLARITGRTNAGHVCDFLGRTGHGVFDRATPDGYPELDSLYTDSNAMIQRWRYAQDLAGDLAALVPGPWKQEPARGRGSGADAAPAEEGAWRQRVIDVLAVRITGRLLGEASNSAALRLLEETPGRRAERVLRAAPLVAQVPEAQVR
jgi:hypothetical protein